MEWPLLGLRGAEGPNWSDEQTAEAFCCAPRTVFTVRNALWSAALDRKQEARLARTPLLDGEQEACLIQLACRELPSGPARWTLQLCCRPVGYPEGGGHHRRPHGHACLQKNELYPHQRIGWVIPPELNAEFVAGREDVPVVYRRRDDPKCPVVCVGEEPVQLVKGSRRPPSSEPGQSTSAWGPRSTSPLGSLRKVSVRTSNTTRDLAEEVKMLLEVDFA